jgi:hypothetical protein
MGQPIFPAAGYIETLLALQDAVFGETRRPILDARIHEPLILSHEQPTEVRVRLRPETDGAAAVEIVSLVPGIDRPIERQHVTAVLGATTDLVPALVEAGAAVAGQDGRGKRTGRAVANRRPVCRQRGARAGLRP